MECGRLSQLDLACLTVNHRVFVCFDCASLDLTVSMHVVSRPNVQFGVLFCFFCFHRNDGRSKTGTLAVRYSAGV